MISPLKVNDARLPTHPDDSRSSAEIEEAARQRVADNCPYWYYFKSIAYEFDEGVLTLRGRVPSFYLKQVLQEVLADLPAIEWIDNHVEVVNSSGLSSVPPR